MLLNMFGFRRAALALLVALTLGASPALAETRVGGRLPDAGATWNKLGSPYIVAKDVIVPAGVTLRIEPGTTVRVKDNIGDGEGTNRADIEIIVEGTLVAHGAEGDTVLFTSDSATPRRTDWQGIVLRGKPARLDLRAVNIEYANEGIKVQDGEVTAKDVTIRQCHQMGINFIGGRGTLDNALVTLVGHTSGTGVGINLDRGARVEMRRTFLLGTQNGIQLARGSSATVEECTVSLCLGRGIGVRNSEAVITGTTVTANDWGIELSAGSRATVRGNNIFENGTSDLTIVGYGPDPVKVDVSGNWWGQTNVAAIQERVTDGLDNPSEKGIAVVEPILMEAVTRPASKN